MKYYIDTEFIEGFTRPYRLGKSRHFIELISIAIVAEDGREYYAISKEFNPKLADRWVKENVIDKIEAELYQKLSSAEKFVGRLCGLKYLLKRFGKSNKQIAQDIFNFVNPDLGFHVSAYSNSEFRNPGSYTSKHFDSHNVTVVKDTYVAQPEFYAYYADYDWVLLCSLFGRMIDLPAGFPKYCRDLKQIMDEKYAMVPGEKSFTSLDEKLKIVKERRDFPQETNSHNALSDARWNQKLHEFLTTK